MVSDGVMVRNVVSDGLYGVLWCQTMPRYVKSCYEVWGMVYAMLEVVI